MIIILITTIIRITKAFRCSILTVQTSHCRQHCTNLQNCQIVWFCSLSSQSWYCVWLFDLCLIWSWSEFVWSEARQTLVYGEIPHKVNTNWNCLGQVLQGARRTNGMIIAMIIITGTLLWFVWWVERGFPDLLEPPDPFRAWVDSQKELEGGEEGSLVRNNSNNISKKTRAIKTTMKEKRTLQFLPVTVVCTYLWLLIKQIRDLIGKHISESIFLSNMFLT